MGQTAGYICTRATQCSNNVSGYQPFPPWYPSLFFFYCLGWSYLFTKIIWIIHMITYFVTLLQINYRITRGWQQGQNIAPQGSNRLSSHCQTIPLIANYFQVLQLFTPHILMFPLISVLYLSFRIDNSLYTHSSPTPYILLSVSHICLISKYWYIKFKNSYSMITIFELQLLQQLYMINYKWLLTTFTWTYNIFFITHNRLHKSCDKNCVLRPSLEKIYLI